MRTNTTNAPTLVPSFAKWKFPVSFFTLSNSLFLRLFFCMPIQNKTLFADSRSLGLFPTAALPLWEFYSIWGNVMGNLYCVIFA